MAAVVVAVAGCASSVPSSGSPSTAIPTTTATIPSPTPSPTTPGTPSATPSPAFGPSSATQEALVVRVVDGDTIQVSIAGQLYKVRYIGIDTPETVDPNSPVQWMGPEASAANTSLVGGKVVYLERDVSETDRFGRLLRYVWLSEPTGWLLVNRELVREGFAASSTYPPDVRYQDLFIEAQREAAAAQLGLWGPAPTPTEPPLPLATSKPPAQPTQPVGCDPSYPTVCIAPYPPDLDCKDVPYRNFEVLEPDPHRFDGDNDGIGCEA